MKDSEILIKALDLIKNPANWMQGDYNNSIAYEKEPTCFCGIGAIAHVIGDSKLRLWPTDVFQSSAYKTLESVVAERISTFNELLSWQGDSFAVFNDNVTHAEVIKAFEVAIAVAQTNELN